MKVALLTDIHFGLRQDSLAFQDNIQAFLDYALFPELESRGITHIINAGDVFDSRKKIDMRTAAFARKHFFERLEQQSITMDIILGNHDIYYKNDVKAVTALEELASDYDNITVFNECQEEISGIIYIPWITPKNREQTFEAISKSNAKIAIGHLELNGYQFSKVQTSSHGDDPQLLSKFDHVFSGHFHHRHTKGNITYLGSPTEHTWIDAHDPRGFHIFDLATHELEFVENPYTMFEYISYPELPEHGKKFFRVKVGDDTKPSELSKYREKLEQLGALDIKFLTTGSSSGIRELNEGEEIEFEDALSFLTNHVEDELKDLVEHYYNKALLEV